MRLSISIKEGPDGFTPQLVLEVPRYFQVISASKVPSTTFKEAWMVAKVYREYVRSNWSEVRTGNL